MANIVKVKRSATPAKVPTTSDLQLGEIAVNTYDGKMYIKKNDGTDSIVQIGAGGGGSGDVVGPASATDNAIARFDSTTGKLIQNSVVTVSDTGAIAGVLSITDPNFVDFNTGYTTPVTTGQLGWDGTFNSLALGMIGGNVIQHIGEDTYIYVKASSAITRGQVVMFTGSVGASGVATAAPSTGVTNGQTIIGVAAESIALNGFGLIQTYGELRSVNTSAFADGDILYYNSAVTGGFTTTYPSSGPIITVAAVLNGGSAGGGVITIRVSVTQRLTASTGISVSQTSTGSTITNTGVTSVTGTSPVVSSGGATPAISLATAYGDTLNPYASKTANFVLAAPNGTAGVPTFRAIVAADIPTLNQNTTGTASNVTGTVAIANGGTGSTTAANALTALGAYPASNPNGYTNNVGTVTSVAMTVPTGLSISGTPITTSGTLAVTLTAGYSIPTTTSQTNWDTAFTERQQWSGTSTNLVAATGRTSLGATTLGSNIFTITNPSAITFPRFNADNTISALDAATFRTAIGAGTSSTTGTVTSVGGTGTVSGLSLSGTVTTSGNLTLGGTLAVTASNFASQTANTFLSAPNGAAGVPTFRAIVAADVPTLNQNTTGTAATITGVYSGTITSGQITTGLGFTPYNATNPNSYIALASAITGYTAGTNTALAATDTLLVALGKLQGQVTARGTGTVTSVGGTGTVSGLSLSGTVTTTGNLTLGGTLAVTPSNFASQTANTALAAPDGSNGVPTFRNLFLTDMPDAWAKRNVKASSPTNLTLSGAQTIDGVSCVAGDRVLVRAQTTASQNGIYTVQTGAWTRTADGDTAAKMAGAVVSVDQGTVSGGVHYDTDFKTTDTLGTTAMGWNRVVDTGYFTVVGNNFATLTSPSAVTFPRMNADNTVSALDAATFRTAIGAGTSSTTGTVTSVVAGTGLSGGTITTTGTIALANTTVAAGSYTNASITVDAQGRLTAASSGSGGSGTVTSVSGTGTVSGLTLTGTVTTTGSLTLGGNLSITADMIYQSFTATAAQTTFTPTTAYTASKIEVYANGVLMRNGSDVTVTSGTSVVFASGLPVGTLVDVVYPI